MSDAPLRGVQVDGAAAAGFDPDGLRRAFGLLDGWVAEGVLPAAGALVTRGGRVAGEAYLGVAHRAQGRAADSDTIWGLASITKPVTATAAMLLVERGLVALDEPIARLLPEFLDAPATAFDRAGVTLRQALAHCSGLPGVSENNLTLRQAHRPLADFVRAFMGLPLVFAPGTAHYYSNPGIVLAAELIGRSWTGALGQAVDAPAIGHYHPFVHDQILAPLGMTSSSLLPPPAWADRIAWVADTGYAGLDWEMANSAYYRGLGIPWGGLFSRPRDLIRFVDLFLPAAGGRSRLDPTAAATDRPIISPATARAMTSVQFAPPDAPMSLAPTLRDHPLVAERDRVEWGIGWEVRGGKRAHPSGNLTSPATYSHLGATGTMAWGDPATDIACVLLTNRTLRSGWAGDRPRQELFSNAVMAAAHA